VTGRHSRFVHGARLALVVALALASSACRQDMHDAAKYEPLEKSDFFADGRASRSLLPGTVARGHLRADELFYTGKDANGFATVFPMEITPEVLAHGRERFNIYCAPCHDRTASGRGMIVERGFPQPRSFHDPMLKIMPHGYFFNVMTNGFGRMFPYSSRVTPADRWAIIAYIRTLQYSQNVPVSDLTSEEIDILDGKNEQEPAKEDHGHHG
jgi:mono/diheme cytochrome c family protein